jgi:hypothetical protein
MARWEDIAFKPDEEFSDQAWEYWRWLVDEPWDLILCSMFGAMFFEKRLSGGVFRLDGGTGKIERVADEPAEFHRLLGAGFSPAWQERVDAWFCVPFVYQLHAAGRKPRFGECFGLKILPVSGGSYTADNVFILPCIDWIRATGEALRLLSDQASAR